MDEDVIALRPVQLVGLGLLTYGLARRSWAAGLFGLGLLAFDARRESAKPEFSPLDLVATHQAGVTGDD